MRAVVRPISVFYIVGFFHLNNITKPLPLAPRVEIFGKLKVKNLVEHKTSSSSRAINSASSNQ